MRNCAADFFKTRKIPQIRKVAALLWLYGLHGAVISLQKYTLLIGFFLQNEPPPVLPQARKLLNEVMLAYLQKSRETGDLVVGQSHLSRPSAAGGAALALVKNRHDEEFIVFLQCANELFCNFDVKSLEQLNNSLVENRARVSSFYPGMRQFVGAPFSS
jgi:hypothetical protein